ncbi:hypothetical protein [Nonomuraea recticatena]|uniref:Uncharacterized protein n=1 Tax=Nonomuraea recticatena TaxID=46178 RepID=A0ABP6F7G2_9ACTN
MTSTWAVSPDAITEVIPRITIPPRRDLATAHHDTAEFPVIVAAPVDYRQLAPVEARPLPFRPWRMIWCLMAFGHFWFPGVAQCLDCGWGRRR